MKKCNAIWPPDSSLSWRDGAYLRHTYAKETVMGNPLRGAISAGALFPWGVLRNTSLYRKCYYEFFRVLAANNAAIIQDLRWQFRPCRQKCLRATRMTNDSDGTRNVFVHCCIGRVLGKTQKDNGTRGSQPPSPIHNPISLAVGKELFRLACARRGLLNVAHLSWSGWQSNGL